MNSDTVFRITTPTVNATKFILNKNDIKLYITFVSELSMINKNIDKDQEKVLDELSRWVDGEPVMFDQNIFPELLSMIDFINNIYDHIINALRQSRFMNIEKGEKQVLENKMTEDAYNRYCKNLKSLWELIDAGVYKLWFERRGAVLSRFNIKKHKWKITVDVDCISIIILNKK